MSPHDWEERELPVLHAVVDEFEANGGRTVTVTAIASRSGLDAATVRMSLKALEQAQPPFFGSIETRVNRIAVSNPTERARRAVGRWPTPEDVADRFIAAYEKAVADAETEDQRSAGRRVVAELGGIGRGVLVEVLARMATGAV